MRLGSVAPMRSPTRIAGTSILALATAAALLAGPSPASAAPLKCDIDHANELLAAHGVTAAKPESSVAFLHREKGTRFCWVSADMGGRSGIRLHTSPNGVILWTTIETSQVKRKYTEKQTFTAAGRKAFGVRWQTFAQTSTTTAKKAKKQITFRKADGSTGKRVSTTTNTKKGWKHQITINLVAKDGARTRIAIRENCRLVSGPPRCTGKHTSNKKRFRGPHDVRLKMKRQGDFYISHGQARSGKGKAVYNRVYKLERKQFEQERNGMAGGAG